MTDIDDKLVLVTGAASGIGRATAKLAAERGARLVLTDLDAGGLQATVAEIREGTGSSLMPEPSTSPTSTP